MKSLSPDNQAILNLSRWPPNWYGKVKRKYQIYLLFLGTLKTMKYMKDLFIPLQQKRKETHKISRGDGKSFLKLCLNVGNLEGRW